MAFLSITSNLREVSARLKRMASSAGSELGLAVSEQSASLAEEVTQIVREHTPIGEERSNAPVPGHLVDTTGFRISPRPLGPVVEITQGKEVPRGYKFPGVNISLAQVLRTGRVGGYVVTPVVKKALWWDSADHPTLSQTPGPVPPNTYIADAMAEAEPLVGHALEMAGNDVVFRVSRFLR